MNLKNYFNLTTPYRFEWNDWVGGANALNLFLVVKFGLVASWFGLIVNLACVLYDIIAIRRINLTVLHFSVVLLNAYFLGVLYNLL